MAFMNKTGKAQKQLQLSQEEMPVAVLQDHVTGEVFNTHSCNIA